VFGMKHWYQTNFWSCRRCKCKTIMRCSGPLMGDPCIQILFQSTCHYRGDDCRMGIPTVAELDGPIFIWDEVPVEEVEERETS